MDSSSDERPSGMYTRRRPLQYEEAAASSSPLTPPWNCPQSYELMSGPRRRDPYGLDAYKHVGDSSYGHSSSSHGGHYNPNILPPSSSHHDGTTTTPTTSSRYNWSRSLGQGYQYQYTSRIITPTESSNHHPLHPSSSSSTTSISISHNDALSAAGAACDPLSPPPRGITSTVLRALKRQAHRFADSMAGRYSPPSKDDQDITALSTSYVLNILLVVLPVLLLCWYGAPTAVDHATRPTNWKWSPGRRLDNRRCVMNLFVERQPPDEFNPDIEEIKPGEKNKDGTPKLPKPPKIIEGTYRTKGQMHVISRFIEAVADSFRSNNKLQQHVIFAGARDSGHLAEQALKHWPPRGTYRTQVHIIADDNNNSNNKEEDALDYGNLDAIEYRFKGKPNTHIYDRQGFAGVQGDDDEAPSLDLPEEEEEDNIDVPTNMQRSTPFDNGTEPKLPYPDFYKMIYPDGGDSEDEDGNNMASLDNIVVPYLHIDGRTYADQIEIINTAKPLLLNNKIVAVGLEHSPDLDVHDLIQRFRDVHYKTFFLGSRQITRVDHLCPEILDDVLAHPTIQPPPLHPIRKLAIKYGWVEKPKDDLYRIDENGNYRPTPPFFVAMPKGRRMKEEMTIQHMYDLFGGYGGGGGQVKTANDRKAPGKK